jgi:hypothetical protein
MSKEQIRAALVAVLKQVQELSGRTWSILKPTDKPIGSLDGFDSLCSIEATVMVEQKLGVALGTNSVFVSDDGKQALSIEEITQRVHGLMPQKKGNS